MSRSKQYNKQFKFYREEIWNLKEEGLTPMAILLYYRAKGIELNYKSIQSVKAPFMNSPYRSFKIEAVQYLIDYLQQLTNLSRMIEDYIEKDDRQLWKSITQKMNQLCGSNSHLRHLLPENREETEMRRIKKEIREKVIEKIIGQRSQQQQQIVNDPSDEVVFEDNNQNLQQEEDQDLDFMQDQPFQGMDNPTYLDQQFLEPDKIDWEYYDSFESFQ